MGKLNTFSEISHWYFRDKANVVANLSARAHSLRITEVVYNKLKNHLATKVLESFPKALKMLAQHYS